MIRSTQSSASSFPVSSFTLPSPRETSILLHYCVCYFVYVIYFLEFQLEKQNKIKKNKINIYIYILYILYIYTKNELKVRELVL